MSVMWLVPDPSPASPSLVPIWALPGSSLQVSGPAAGLTVLVHEAVHTHGPTALGVLVAGRRAPADRAGVCIRARRWCSR
ncbi:hypothetical protein [Streptomyces sp. NPDC058695]|uniref:hypothetical protein n=1 Tax=Streptomyces sp. NPDC058695 TaxID=3346604 RepID=UPI00365D22F5